MVQQCRVVRASQLVPALFYKLQRVPTRSTEEGKVILVPTGLLGQLHGEGKVRAAISDIWVTLVPPSPLSPCLSGPPDERGFQENIEQRRKHEKECQIAILENNLQDLCFKI